MYTRDMAKKKKKKSSSDMAADLKSALQSLNKMIGYAKYVEEMDWLYFREEVQPGLKNDLAEAEAIAAKLHT